MAGFTPFSPIARWRFRYQMQKTLLKGASFGEGAASRKERLDQLDLLDRGFRTGLASVTALTSFRKEAREAAVSEEVALFFGFGAGIAGNKAILSDGGLFLSLTEKLSSLPSSCLSVVEKGIKLGAGSLRQRKSSGKSLHPSDNKLADAWRNTLGHSLTAAEDSFLKDYLRALLG